MTDILTATTSAEKNPTDSTPINLLSPADTSSPSPRSVDQEHRGNSPIQESGVSSANIISPNLPFTDLNQTSSISSPGSSSSDQILSPDQPRSVDSLRHLILDNMLRPSTKENVIPAMEMDDIDKDQQAVRVSGKDLVTAFHELQATNDELRADLESKSKEVGPNEEVERLKAELAAQAEKLQQLTETSDIQKLVDTVTLKIQEFERLKTSQSSQENCHDMMHQLEENNQRLKAFLAARGGPSATPEKDAVASGPQVVEPQVNGVEAPEIAEGLESVVNSLRTTVDKLNTDNKDLAAQLAARDSLSQCLSDEIESFKSSIDAQKKELELLREELSKLKSSKSAIGELKALIKKLEKDNKKLTQNLAAKEVEIASGSGKKDEMESLQSRLEFQEKAMEQLKIQNSALAAKSSETVEKAIQELKLENEKLKRELTSNNKPSDSSRIRDIDAILHKKIEGDLKKVIQELTSDGELLKADLVSRTMELQELKAKMSPLEGLKTSVRELTNLVQQLVADNDKLKAKLAAKDSQLEQLKETPRLKFLLKKLESEADEMRISQKNSKIVIAQLNADNNVLKIKLTAKQNQMDLFENRAGDWFVLKSRNEELEGLVKNSKIEMNKLLANLFSLQNGGAQKVTDTSGFEQEIQRLIQEVTSKDKELKRQEEEMESFKAKEAASINRNDVEIERLAKEIASKDEKLKRQEEQIEALKAKETTAANQGDVEIQRLTKEIASKDDKISFQAETIECLKNKEIVQEKLIKITRRELDQQRIDFEAALEAKNKVLEDEPLSITQLTRQVDSMKAQLIQAEEKNKKLQLDIPKIESDWKKIVANHIKNELTLKQILSAYKKKKTTSPTMPTTPSPCCEEVSQPLQTLNLKRKAQVAVDDVDGPAAKRPAPKRVQLPSISPVPASVPSPKFPSVVRVSTPYILLRAVQNPALDVIAPPVKESVSETMSSSTTPKKSAPVRGSDRQPRTNPASSSNQPLTQSRPRFRHAVYPRNRISATISPANSPPFISDETDFCEEVRSPPMITDHYEPETADANDDVIQLDDEPGNEVARPSDEASMEIGNVPVENNVNMARARSSGTSSPEIVFEVITPRKAAQNTGGDVICLDRERGSEPPDPSKTAEKCSPMGPSPSVSRDQILGRATRSRLRIAPILDDESRVQAILEKLSSDDFCPTERSVQTWIDRFAPYKQGEQPRERLLDLIFFKLKAFKKEIISN